MKAVGFLVELQEAVWRLSPLLAVPAFAERESGPPIRQFDFEGSVGDRRDEFAAVFRFKPVARKPYSNVFPV